MPTILNHALPETVEFFSHPVETTVMQHRDRDWHQFYPKTI